MEKLPEPKLLNLNIADLPQVNNSVPPSPKFIKSIEKLGVIVPIIVRLLPAGNFKIIEGRRRVVASRITKKLQIPARVFDSSWEDDDIMSLILNEQRENNMLSAWHAVEKLLKRGMGEKLICQETGMTSPQMHNLLKLRKLLPELKEFVSDGRMKITTAIKVAGMPAGFQKRLLKIGNKYGKIKQRDMNDLRRTRKVDSLANLSLGLFQEEVPSWGQVASEKLNELKRLIENQGAPGKFLKLIDSALEMANQEK